MNPRIKIHKDGRATLAGLDYQSLRQILTSAFLLTDERQKKAEKKGDQEALDYYRGEHQTVRQCLASMDEAIKATHGPPPPETKESRFAAVQHAKNERVLIDNLITSLTRRTACR
jgi:hypothetical protein